MIVWKNSPDFHPVSYPERVKCWKKCSAAALIESRRCGGITVTTCHLPPPETIPVPGKIVFLADFHFQDTPIWRRRLSDVESALAELRPELLLLGGDAVADAVDLPALSELLRSLSRHASNAFAVPGNWEQTKYWLSRDFWRDLYRDCGFTWLDNRMIRCGSCCITGVEDLRGEPRLPGPPPPKTCNILLSHRPDTVVQLDQKDALKDYSLILCGHLHGGQVRLPILGPLAGHSLYGRKLDSGLYRRRSSDGQSGPCMIITSGLGELSFPFRFNCPREIVAVDHDRT